MCHSRNAAWFALVFVQVADDADTVRTGSSEDGAVDPTLTQWTKHFDPGRSKFYYWNTATKTSSWTLPEGHSVVAHTHGATGHHRPQTSSTSGAVASVSYMGTVQGEGGWLEVWDAKWRRCYWFHPATGRSSWTHPDHEHDDDESDAEPNVHEVCNATTQTQVGVAWSDSGAGDTTVDGNGGEDESWTIDRGSVDSDYDARAAAIRWLEAHRRVRSFMERDLVFSILIRDHYSGGTGGATAGVSMRYDS